MSDWPEELYIENRELGVRVVEENFDSFPEGARVAIYVFAGTATVKVRREALLIDDDSKIVRNSIASAEPVQG